MQVELAQSTVRAQVVKEYEEKMLEMERRYQARLREEVRLHFARVIILCISRTDAGGARVRQADEAENKLNAKLDILTRLQAAKTPGRGGATAHRLREESLTPSTTYDDSDEEDMSEEEEAGGATEREDHLAAEEDEEEGTNNDSEEVERMLMPGAEDADVSRLLFRVTLCVVQTVS